MMQQPKPFHPQQNFSLSTYEMQWPFLAKYGFTADFTVMDILDNMAQRLQLIEAAQEQQPAEEPEQRLRLGQRIIVAWHIISGRRPLHNKEYPQ